MILFSDYISTFDLYRKSKDEKTRTVLLSVIYNRYRKEWEFLIDAYNSYARRTNQKTIVNWGFASLEAVNAIKDFNKTFNLPQDKVQIETLQFLYANVYNVDRKTVWKVLTDFYKFDKIAELDKYKTQDSSKLNSVFKPIKFEKNPVYVSLIPYQENKYKVITQALNAIYKRTGVGQFLPNWEILTESVKEQIHSAIKKLQAESKIKIDGEINCTTLASIFANVEKSNPIKVLVQNLLLTSCKLSPEQILKLQKQNPKGKAIIENKINVTEPKPQPFEKLISHAPASSSPSAQSKKDFWLELFLASVLAVISFFVIFKNRKKEDKKANQKTKQRGKK